MRLTLQPMALPLRASFKAHSGYVFLQLLRFFHSSVQSDLHGIHPRTHRTVREAGSVA